MPEHYNPVVRTFMQLRSALIYVTGRRRHEIRRHTLLSDFNEITPDKTLTELGAE
jgi:hypothetical protein